MKRIGFALLTFVVWTSITVLGGRMQSGPEGGLYELVSSGIGWPFAAAAALVLAVTLGQGWTDVGLDRLPRPGLLRLTWLPLIYITGFLTFGSFAGLPTPGVIALILINCLLVGLSEELMFRGILLQAFRHAMPIWPAILITSAMFGAVHSLNVFVTGDLGAALVQSTAAFLSGLYFMALRLRSGSLWPAILLHGLWDFGTFLMSSAGQAGLDQSGPGLGWPWMLLPVAFVAPNAIFALYLLRGVARSHRQPLD